MTSPSHLPERAATHEPPLVSVVIVVYNGQADLADCVASVRADAESPAAEMLIVDNASTDGSLALAESVAAGQADARVLASPANRGYAGGVNLALAHARGRYVAILNQDMLVTPGWLARLVAFLETQPEAGAVNPLILLHDGTEAPGRINAAGQDVHVTGLGFNRWLGQPRSRAGLRPMRVSGLQGGALVVRRALLEQMGGWDESGFLYHEDVELSWLLQMMGHDLYCVPGAVVLHKYHLTMYPEKLFLLERNRTAMLLTHLETSSLAALAPWLAFTEMLMWGYCLLRGWPFLKAKAASYQWVAQHRPRLRDEQARLRALRRRSDREVLARLRWGYAWDQFFTLGRERGDSRRRPAGGLPVNPGPP